MLKTKKILFIALPVIIAALAGACIFFSAPKEFSVAFYRIDERQRQGITDTLNKIANGKNINVLYTTYNSEKSLKEQIPLAKKPSIIFTSGGFPLEEALDRAAKSAAIPMEKAQGLTSSIQSAIVSESGMIRALPILSSHLEVDIDLAEFNNSNTKYIVTWNDVEKFMREQKRKKESPMVFAGGNADFLLDFIGAMAESIDGVSSYREAAKILQETKNPYKAAKLLCDEPDSPLATSIKQIKAWYKLGFIHPGAFSMQYNDVEAFASSRLSSVLIMSLENHRAMAQKTISRFTSIYFPSDHAANERIFTGNLYYAIPMVKSEKGAQIMAELASTETQENLSRATGMAPVLAQCRVPDKQANDARYWIACTEAPLPGLSKEAYLSKKDKSDIAAELASRIKN